MTATAATPGSTDADSPVVVVDEVSFYAADPRRRTSEEQEYGALWRRADADGDEVWRLALICDTGELFLARVDPYPGPETELRLLRIVGAPAEADALLEGWQEQCGQPGSLQWLEERLSAA
jgi:hypothetical protein